MTGFNRDQIKMLAEAERMMDDGRFQFVKLRGSRVIVQSACMEEFGLHQGQTINDDIFTEILKWNIADLEAKIAERKLGDLP